MGRNALTMLGCRVGADLLNFVVFVIVSRQFGPAGIGVYAYGFAIAGLVYSATTLGIDEYGIREYTRRAPHSRSQLLSELLGAQTCIAALSLLALAVYLVLTQPEPATLAIVLSLTLYQLGSAFSSTLFVPAMAEQQMVAPAAITFLCRALAMVAVVVLIRAVGLPLASAMWAFAAAGVLLLVLSAASAATHGSNLRPRMAMATLVDGMRTLWSFAAVDVMGQVVSRIGVIALSLQIGSAAAGLYATGLKLVEVASLPLLFIGLAAYPQLCRAFRDPPRFAQLSRKGLIWGSMLAALIALVLYLAVPPLLVPVLGASYAGAEPIVAAMAAVAFAFGLEIVLGRLLLAANLNVARAAWMGIGAIVCAVATVVAVPSFGIGAAIAAAVCAYLLIVGLYAVSLFETMRHKIAAAVALPTSASAERCL